MMRLTAQFICTTFAIVLLAMCSEEPPRINRETAIEDVTFAEILADPKKFDHVKVRVKGIARIEFEANSLYSDLKAYNAKGWKDALWLRIGWPVAQEIAELNGREVIVEGTFDASSKGHEGMFFGSIVKVDRLSPTR